MSNFDPTEGTPKRSIFPPLRVILSELSKALILPVASIVTSTPNPSVLLLTTSSRFWLFKFTVVTPYFSTNFSLKSLTSETTMLLAPQNLASNVCITPVGPAPKIATLSPCFIEILFSPLMQHANGSIKAASSNDIESGSFKTPPCSIFHFGTINCSDNPHGSILLVW